MGPAVAPGPCGVRNLPSLGDAKSALREQLIFDYHTRRDLDDLDARKTHSRSHRSVGDVKDGVSRAGFDEVNNTKLEGSRRGPLCLCRHEEAPG